MTIPPAVAALIAAVAAENPLAQPDALGRLVVAAMADEGWRVSPEPFRVPVSAVSAPCRVKSHPCVQRTAA